MSTAIASRSASKTASSHVAQILAVGLERERPVAHDLDSVEVVTVKDVPRLDLATAGEHVAQEPRQRERPDLRRRDHVQPELEPRFGRDVHRHAARIGVGIGVGHEREGRAAEPPHLERRLEAAAPAPDEPRGRAQIGRVARTLAVVATPERVHAAHELCVEADSRGEAEAPPVHPAERDAAPPPLLKCLRHAAAAATGSRGSPSARAPAPGRARRRPWAAARRHRARPNGASSQTSRTRTHEAPRP